MTIWVPPKLEKEQGDKEKSCREIRIQRPESKIMLTLNKLFSNPANKPNLADFLCMRWCEMAMSKLDPGQKLFIAGGFRDGALTKCAVQGCISDVPELVATHSEADTCIFLHAAHAARRNERLMI